MTTRIDQFSSPADTWVSAGPVVTSPSNPGD